MQTPISLCPHKQVIRAAGGIVGMVNEAAKAGLHDWVFCEGSLTASGRPDIAAIAASGPHLIGKIAPLGMDAHLYLCSWPAHLSALQRVL